MKEICLTILKENSFVALCIIGSVYYLLKAVIYHLPRRITIWLHGYPPFYCDVDGDFKKEKEE